MRLLKRVLAGALALGIVAGCTGQEALEPTREPVGAVMNVGAGEATRNPASTSTPTPTSPPPTATPASTPTPTPVPVRSRYLALGDSITVGTGASEASKGYVSLVDAHYRAHHQGALPVLNLGSGGESSTSFLNAQWPKALDTFKTGSDVRLVTLTLGANDYMGLITSNVCGPQDLFCAMRVLAQALADYQARYDRILAGLATARPGEAAPVVVVTTYYNPYDGASATRDATLTRYEMIVDYALLGADGKVDCNALNLQSNIGLNDVITCRAAAHGAVVADVYPVFNGRAAALTHPISGGHHPNDEGHRLIAETVINALTRAGV